MVFALEAAFGRCRRLQVMFPVALPAITSAFLKDQAWPYWISYPPPFAPPS